VELPEEALLEEEEQEEGKRDEDLPGDEPVFVNSE